jgi:flavin reductase (DIM6/NTAB) family NADH-FMN oxidoreductase RutF
MNGYDAADLTPSETYRILTTATSPRPIGWVSTTSQGGVDNLAPFSHYNNVCTTKPIVLFSVDEREDGGVKNTVSNVRATEEFVVNVVTDSLVTEMERTSDEVASDVDEFEYAGLEKADSLFVTPPRVADSVVQMECSLYDLVEIYDRHVVFGEIEYFHIDDQVLTDGKIDVHKLDTVGRLGGKMYTTLSRAEYDEI